VPVKFGRERGRDALPRVRDRKPKPDAEHRAPTTRKTMGLGKQAITGDDIESRPDNPLAPVVKGE
jgi:hypothetical protein